MSGVDLASGILGGLTMLAIGMAMPELPTWRRIILFLALVGVYWSGLYIAVDTITKAQL
jgi:hypothetical protein